MNKKALNTAFTGLIKRLEATEKFVIDQAPQICKEMIRERAIEVTMQLVGSLVLSIILLVISSKSGWYAHVKSNTNLESEVIGWWILSIGAGLFSLPSLGIFWDSIQSLILLKNCPKLFLIRSFRSLIK